MTTTATSKQTALKRRIRQFYSLLNQRNFAKCHRMIDPRVRLNPASVTLFQYSNAMREFLSEFRTVEILEIGIELKKSQPNSLYEGREFAIGKTTWTDGLGESHVFLERWVREGRGWYTRSTGFVVPSKPKAASPIRQAAVVAGVRPRNGRTQKVRQS